MRNRTNRTQRSRAISKKKTTALVQRRAKKRAFLELLEDGISVIDARRAIKVARSTVYEWYKHDPEFMEMWEQALTLGDMNMQLTAYRRGCEQSDKLLIFMMKKRMPDQYGDKADRGGDTTLFNMQQINIASLSDVPLTELIARLDEGIAQDQGDLRTIEASPAGDKKVQ